MLITVKRDPIYELIPKEDHCEFLAVKVSCKRNSLIVASLYRPTNNDSDYAIRLASAMENLATKHPKDVVWIRGDVLTYLTLNDQRTSVGTVTGKILMKHCCRPLKTAVWTKWWISPQEKIISWMSS